MREEGHKRITRLLEQDKEEMNDESRKASLRDFRYVAQEYFELEGEPSLTVTRQRRGFDVTLTFHALRVKNFTVIK